MSPRQRKRDPILEQLAENLKTIGIQIQQGDLVDVIDAEGKVVGIPAGLGDMLGSFKLGSMPETAEAIGAIMKDPTPFSAFTTGLEQLAKLEEVRRKNAAKRPTTKLGKLEQQREEQRTRGIQGAVILAIGDAVLVAGVATANPAVMGLGLTMMLTGMIVSLFGSVGTVVKEVQVVNLGGERTLSLGERGR